MPIAIPQIQDKKHRVCSYCRFKKVKCTGGHPCSTCKKDNKVCIVWAPMEDERGVFLRQGTINTYTMQQCVMHQALVDIIQSGIIPEVPAEALTSPHALLSAMGVIDEKDDAIWKHNLEQPWAQTASGLAITSPHEKKPHASRGPKDADKPSAAKRPRKQAARQPQPTCPDTPAPAVTAPPAQNTGWQHQAAVAPAPQELGYKNQPFVGGQAYAPVPVESTFNSAAPSTAAAIPPAPGCFFGAHPYNQGNAFLPPSFPVLNTTQGYGQFPATYPDPAHHYQQPQPAQWQQWQQQPLNHQWLNEPQWWPQQQQQQQQQQPAAAASASVPAPAAAAAVPAPPAPADAPPVIDLDAPTPPDNDFDIDALFTEPPVDVSAADFSELCQDGPNVNEMIERAAMADGVDQHEEDQGMDMADMEKLIEFNASH